MATQAKYWCRQPLLVTVDGPFGRFSTTVEKPFARIGSHESSEIVLPDSQVARRGLYLHATDEGIFCIRLSARQGSGDLLRGWLPPNQSVALGPYRVAAELANGGLPMVQPPADLELEYAVPPPYPMVAITRKGHEIARHPLVRRLTVVGRGKVSTLRLSDTFVSVAHCVLYQEAGAVWMVDLLSANGTRFQGETIESVALPVGESVALGGSELTYALCSYGPEATSKDRPHGTLVASATPTSSPDMEADRLTCFRPDRDLPDALAVAGPSSGGSDGDRQSPSLVRLQAELEAQRQLLLQRESEWLAQQREYEAELKRRSEDLARQREVLLAEQQEANRQRVQWQEQIVQSDRERSEQAQRLEQRLAELQAQFNELQSQRERWEGEQARQQADLAGRRRELEAEGDRSAALAADTDPNGSRGGGREPSPMLPAGDSDVSPGRAVDLPGGSPHAARGARWPTATLDAPTLAAALVRNAADCGRDVQGGLEQLTERVTDRLIKIQQVRILRGRLKALLAALLVVGVIVCGSVLWLSGYGTGLFEWLRSSQPGTP